MYNIYNMSKEDKFNFDIANLKQDFAIENINILDSDIDILKQYSNNEITMTEMINTIKEKTLKGI